MNLESVVQSEVSQKEKNKYRMLTHIYGILRTRGGEMVSWGEVSEWHGLIYTTKCKIASGKQPHSTGRSARCFVTT